MGFKARNKPYLWQQPQAVADAEKILEINNFTTIAYGELARLCSISQQRTEMAVRRIAYTTDLIKGTDLLSVHFRKRPCSSEAEHLHGKQGVGGSIPPLGSTQPVAPALRPIAPSPRVHYWPEGPPKVEYNRYSLWCGSVVGRGIYQYGKATHPVSYYWTKNIDKITCTRCENKLAREQSPKVLRVLGIIEIK